MKAIYSFPVLKETGSTENFLRVLNIFTLEAAIEDLNEKRKQFRDETLKLDLKDMSAFDEFAESKLTKSVYDSLKTVVSVSRDLEGMEVFVTLIGA